MILTDDIIIIYKNNNKKTIKTPRSNMHKLFFIKSDLNEIAFNTVTNILNIFNN